MSFLSEAKGATKARRKACILLRAFKATRAVCQQRPALVRYAYELWSALGIYLGLEVNSERGAILGRGPMPGVMGSCLSASLTLVKASSPATHYS